MDQGLTPMKVSGEKFDAAKPITLTANQDYSVDPKIKRILVGLGWKPDIDLDASAALLNPYFKSVDQIWWKNLVSKCQSVKHNGDDRVGDREGDCETIEINLEAVPFNVYHILFVVNIHTASINFSQVEKAYVRLFEYVKGTREKDLCSFSFAGVEGDAMLMGVLSRNDKGWFFKALGDSAVGNNVREIVEQKSTLEALRTLPSFHPGQRHITVEVLEGKDLAAKDIGLGAIRKPSSDPYYIIKYKETTFQSPHVSKKLNPRWPPNSFRLGNVDECEMRPVSVEIFDYDFVSADDFMGRISIPAGYLFSKGIGFHEEWFTLHPSENPDYADEVVTGEIKLKFTVSSTLRDEIGVLQRPGNH